MIDDLQLRQSVLNELAWDARFDATHVAVTAKSGTVTLTGHVSSYPEIFMVRDAVKKIHGVRVIADELRLRLPSADERDDTDIATSIAHVLEHNVNLPPEDIKAEVSNGAVTLSGEVDWQHQRDHVENQVAHVRGVKHIANRIELRKQLAASDVKEQIEAALSRNAALEASHISVSVDGDEVTLTGKVRAFYERNLVEAAAWNARGVHRVVDRIEVG